jgi:hypothetical protein
MARPIRSIEIYLPLDYNDGRVIPESKYISLQQELLNRFGGVTSIHRQFPLQGVWQTGTEVYQDRVVVFSVMDFSEVSQIECLRYLGRLKQRLKKKFDQLEILIILITVADLLAI